MLVTGCIEQVAYRLRDLTSRPNGVEVLRQDGAISALLGIPPKSWAALLRIVLGHLVPKHAVTATGDGVLLRLLSGEPLDALRCDTGLLAAMCAANSDKQQSPQPRRACKGVVAPISMSTPTASVSDVFPDRSAPPSQPADPMLVARLAATLLQAQGMPSTRDDPSVLAELRGLCTTPRPTTRTVAKMRKGLSRSGIHSFIPVP